MQENAKIGKGWCPFCGGKLKPISKIKEINFEGRSLNIHKDEYREFQETGLLNYIEGPRSHPFSQDFVDLSIMLSVSLVVGIFLLWMITAMGS